MFDTTKEDLKDILTRAGNGKIQLPDFQRDYVWNDEDVVSLIASIAKGFPVGALLTLETGGDVQFRPRMIEGATANGTAPDELLLDGQQRITSLYQSMFSSGHVWTRTPKGTRIKRFYYLDMKQALSDVTDIQDAIIGVPEDRIVRQNFGRDIVLDVSTTEKEYEQDLFPLNKVFDSLQWVFGWQGYWINKGRDPHEIHDIIQRFVTSGVVNDISHYKMPIIRLGKDNRREAICLVFEKVNVGGKKLDAFELVTAIYAAESFDLREDWNGAGAANPGRRARMIGSPNRRDVLTEIASTDFLQAATLLHTRSVRLAKEAQGLHDKELPQVSCKREALLALPLAAYRSHADALEQGFIEAGGFLNEWKIIWHKDIPYPPQIVALASVFAIMGAEARTAAAKEKLSQWFWCVTLGELYGSSTESRLARDVPELVEWIRGTGDRPRSVDEALFQQERLLTLRIRLSAAYKGIHALLMQHGCRDFITGRGADLMTFFNDRIDIHHVFPQAWCKSHGIPPNTFNSIVNKTPLSKLSNIAISGDAPSVYLKRIEAKQNISSEALDAILRTHLIEPEHLRDDDFEAFFAARLRALSGLVAAAMGKAVVEEAGGNEAEEPDSELETEEEEEIV